MTPARSSRRRQPLTRDRIVRAAVSVADREGLDALTMRRLGAELGVEAMSLYKHVANKDQILDALVEEVFGAIDTAGRDGATGGADAAPDWKAAMRVRAASARAVLCRHSWALGLLEARGSTGPAALGYVDSVLGTLRGAGFSPEDAAHAFWTLDSFVYGHVVQEVSGGAAGRTIDGDPSDYPHVAELVTYADSVGFEVDREFEFGLELILDALERTLTQH